MKAATRWPAEWEAQAGILLAWPHEGTDWAANLAAVEGCYRELVHAILGFEDVWLIVADERVRARAQAVIGTRLDRFEGRLHWVELPYDDTWLRDSGPITLLDGRKPRWLDFRFTGWGDKFEASLDDAIPAGLNALPDFAHIARQRVDFALEGGAIESDGQGTLLATWTCLARRHPGKSRAEVESILRETLAVDRFHWLAHGELAGDDTDAHIDTLARFAAPDRIVYQACESPSDPHYEPLQRMAGELEALTTRQRAPYELFPLPFAPAIHAEDGRRLAASYANFLIVNGGVLMPGYEVDTDLDAAEALQAAFPDHDVVIVPCRALIEQNGSLHCLSMQLPEGVIA
ncbi:MAG: agmatine deiminase family protein [Xanthomonadales bacterium PRO6]|nr:Agmatine deiminase [Xanthomonadales bacterium]MCE7932733.1 agmatine deiminase family protein [Xanthomonadales bacterium PRO6]